MSISRRLDHNKCVAITAGRQHPTALYQDFSSAMKPTAAGWFLDLVLTKSGFHGRYFRTGFLAVQAFRAVIASEAVKKTRSPVNGRI